jgi:hypothetical protein
MLLDGILIAEWRKEKTYASASNPAGKVDWPVQLSACCRQGSTINKVNGVPGPTSGLKRADFNEFTLKGGVNFESSPHAPNTPPTIAAIPSVTVYTNQATEFYIAATDVDKKLGVRADTLTYISASSNEPIMSVDSVSGKVTVDCVAVGCTAGNYYATFYVSDSYIKTTTDFYVTVAAKQGDVPVWEAPTPVPNPNQRFDLFMVKPGERVAFTVQAKDDVGCSISNSYTPTGATVVATKTGSRCSAKFEWKVATSIAESENLICFSAKDTDNQNSDPRCFLVKVLAQGMSYLSEGESLIAAASKSGTSWRSLWLMNPHILNPHNHATESTEFRQGRVLKMGAGVFGGAIKEVMKNTCVKDLKKFVKLNPGLISRVHNYDDDELSLYGADRSTDPEVWNLVTAPSSNTYENDEALVTVPTGGAKSTCNFG